MTSVSFEEPVGDKQHRSNSSRPLRLPPSPPDTVKDADSVTTDSDIEESPKIGHNSTTTIPSSSSSSSYTPCVLPPTSRTTQSVLPEDVNTPDSHVPRDPRLIRLTGIHPFNVEAPLTDLWDEGFITSKDLHFVRNHGAVPRVHDHEVLDWSFVVEGLVENPLRMTLKDLLQDFEQVTYPVTLVCAGNRRKEQNLVRKTKGFSWGAAGLSTALWTGVPLDLVLAKAKPLSAQGRRGAPGQKKARYVCFEGADKLPNGYYGTSVKLSWAMDPEKGIMLAHAMNGEPLTPDHGKPLRIVVPGQIGGRSVKWLKRIIVTEAPNDNWYHIYDNRVLPTMVSPEASTDVPETWKDERYAIYELNTNSAIAKPAHDERVSLGGIDNEDTAAARGPAAVTYRFQGYAYAGGGRRVTRVEITLDQGRSWRLAHVSYPEDDYRLVPDGEMLLGGRLDMSWRETCFCWCFWSLDIPLGDLVPSRGGRATDVMVRAMDEGMMVQPRDMYWSVLGMMNNPWYRVVVHYDADCGTLWFEHPTQPALIPGGWMEWVKKAGGDLTNGFWGDRLAEEAEKGAEWAAPAPVKEIAMVNKSVRRDIELGEVKEHSGEAQPWFILDGEVYDGTKFLEGHPGGAASIVGAAGQDVTEEFLAIHSENAKAMMPDYHIGTLDAPSKQLLLSSGDAPLETDTSTRPIFLDAKQWRRAHLASKSPVSPDTKVFTFTLDHAAQEIGILPGQHLLLRLRDPATRQLLIRSYTPFSDPTLARGQLEVLIKSYPTGAMTSALNSLPLGHAVECKGPVGQFAYLGRGRCTVGGGHPRRVRQFVMICAGSGITPILAVLRAIVQDHTDETRCLVLDGNRRPEDILCRAQLDDFNTGSGKESRCTVVHTLSRPGPEWTGAKGRMDRAFLEREVGAPTNEKKNEGGDTMVLVCGPEALEKSVKEVLLDMGWKAEDMFFF